MGKGSAKRYRTSLNRLLDFLRVLAVIGLIIYLLLVVWDMVNNLKLPDNDNQGFSTQSAFWGSLLGQDEALHLENLGLVICGVGTLLLFAACFAAVQLVYYVLKCYVEKCDNIAAIRSSLAGTPQGEAIPLVKPEVRAEIPAAPAKREEPAPEKPSEPPAKEEPPNAAEPEAEESAEVDEMMPSTASVLNGAAKVNWTCKCGFINTKLDYYCKFCGKLK